MAPGLIYRDNILSKEGKKRVEDKVAHLALEPLDSHDFPPKVIVYLAPPLSDGLHKTRVHFREYVKPILVASAFDYEIVEGPQPGQIRSKVREAIRERRRKESNKSIQNDNKSSESNEFTNESQFKSSDKISDGAIVIGRVGFVEYLQGLNDGCYASLLDQPETGQLKESTTGKSEKSTTGKSEESTTNDLEPSKVNNVNDDKSNTKSSQEFIKDEENFSIPELEPIGYIHFYNRIGWKYIPLRIYHALNSYMNFDIASNETTKVVLGNKRKFTKEDLKLGKDEEKFFKEHLEESNLDERIVEKLTIFI
ncbi:4584_t:CDS:2 [Diversispora eburnea]|uniref:Mitochondrial import inner membrane translocase subunit TIM54 n=1 Tax=Diversispora eburnea TaxID=1213867 RepID=A0A9N9F2B4_9GLOM|nr:4584_t:CDS:2 [Diversispora eburnea]